MPTKNDRPIPDLSESTLVHVDGQMFVDTATGMIVSRLGWVGFHGYEKVSVHGKVLPAHRVIYEACVGPIPEGLTINHMDGVKDNNHPSNLVPANMSEQITHAYALGLRVGNGHRGKPKGSRLSVEEIEQVRQAPYGAVTALADRLGITRGYAYQIRSRRRLPAHS